MKKVFILMFITLSTFCKAQTFELTKDGFVNKQDPQKTFVVVEYPNKTQQQLFESALNAVGKVFISPNTVTNKVEYSQISLHATYPSITWRSPAGRKLFFDMDYNLIFEFKDGRMRINGPNINQIVQKATLGDVYMYLTKAERGSTLRADKAIFNNDGSVNEEKHKERIETNMNQLITALVNEMNKFFLSDNEW